MKHEKSPDTVERRFFAGLLDADVEALDQVMADNFILIDVMSGSEVPKSVLLELIGSGQLKFEAIERVESRVRLYGAAAVIHGRTQMSGRFAGEPFSVSSRYTHVYIDQQGQWRMVAAQGTQIASPPAA
jgi:ketosteroid isomerase-like protein